MKHSTSVVYVGFVVLLSSCLLAGNTIDLSGPWKLALDPKSVGIQEGWFEKSLPGQNEVQLPGSIQEQGYGDAPGPDTQWTGSIHYDQWNKPRYAPYRAADNFKMPFWLQPEKYYKGPAWYQKTVTIPRSWKNKHITLILERAHWETKVWIDSTPAGSGNFLSTAHTYELSELLTPGKHTLTIRVDNREVVDVGVNSHSISDHTQSNWNGIVGRIELAAKPTVWIEDVQVYPNLENNAITVTTQCMNRGDTTLTGKLLLDVYSDGKKVETRKAEVTLAPADMTHEAVISFKKPAQTWDEFNPHLYTLKARLKTGWQTDEHLTTFGMRQIKLDDNRLMLNGRKVFMRGTLECAIFPKTGYPPTDVAEWKRIINVCKAHGLNHIRFHSWCPPKAAFIAADELGFYFQVECSSWCNYGGGKDIGYGNPIDQWLYDEADAILKAYGNHPSFLLFAYGNEPGGKHVPYLKKWVSHYKQKDPRRLVTSGSGWPLIAESHFHVSPAPRIQGWGQQLASRINSQPPETTTDYSAYVEKYPNQSVISHEIGQWCVYPNFDEIKKYTGVLKAKNFEVFRDLLEKKHMLNQARDFLMASGKLQTLCYKEDIESALRTPNFGGFQLLDLHDFPGQGTALVGVLDPFWDSKPYVSPVEYKQFSGPIVPLARLPKRTFTSSETLSAQVDVSQFGPSDLNNVTLRWSLLDTAGNTIKNGTLKKDALTAGDLHTVGNVSIELSELPVPAKYTLELSIDKTEAINNWDIWVYPDTVKTQETDDVMIASYLDSKTLTHLQKGGKVLLAVKPPQVKTNVRLGFSSIFWNTAWTRGQAPHTLGILCDPKHPALAAFPTEYHSNWQWSEPIQNAATLEMDHLPKQLRPIVQVVPDWFNPKRLGLVFEAKVNSGSLLVCSVDILNNLADRPVIRQLKHSLLTYMQSEEFRPQTKIDLDAVKALFHEPSPMEKLGVKITTASSFEKGYEPQRAIDNNPATIWHTAWTKEKLAHPHEIQLDLGKPISLKGITCLPRQDGNPNGWIKEYCVYVSSTPDQWGEPIAQGTFKRDASLKTIQFENVVKTRYLRFKAKNGFGNDVFASIAEVNLLLP